MDIRQLKYFLAVSEEQQITAAAKKLHISQPPLSHQIKLLEEELNVQLFERGSRNVQLTEAGTILRHRAEEILELIKLTIKELNDVNEGIHGTLSIGTVASSYSTVIPERLSSFHDKYPNVNFQIWEGDTYRITELLDNGVIEFGFIRTPYNTEHYDSLVLPHKAHNDPMIAVVNDNHNFLSEIDVDVISLSAMKGKPIIIHRRYEERLVKACKKQTFKPDMVCVSDDIRSMLTMADAGLGIAIVPKSTIHLVANDHLIYKEINEPSLETTVALIWVRNRYLSATARHFIAKFSAWKDQMEEDNQF
ncbi:LysR family transcriptional regulator [Terrilactibacillus sp. BCM23-1]|uniref:LysR family transcriptional regulator n=1 Tax=Terrilactibacillus tamarindi TaxID=2599694 RepID=A0A6N8CPZ5_9BACI|nr:LysR family transcriptional regulator [Terrilactibacillus tamarindi]MTT32101.1 LysR family transcriptional regulator [Terrilactibacillus tamarindi]